MLGEFEQTLQLGFVHDRADVIRRHQGHLVVQALQLLAVCGLVDRLLVDVGFDQALVSLLDGRVLLRPNPLGLRCVLVALPPAAPLQRRLADAYRSALIRLDPGDLPEECRWSFKLIRRKLIREKAAGGEADVIASALALSDEEAEKIARATVQIYDRLCALRLEFWLSKDPGRCSDHCRKGTGSGEGRTSLNEYSNTPESVAA